MLLRIALFSLFTLVSLQLHGQEKFRTGAENFLGSGLELIKNKRVGIVTNHTALINGKIHLVDTLVKLATVTTLFGPEHGIRGDAPAGDQIGDSRDAATNLPVFSLYGKIRKPTPEMLQNVDVLIFDIQDVGARFYTYISTLYNCIESAAENNKPIIVLDRANPLGGSMVEGPVIKKDYYSFVGITELPVTHGMTTGELAQYFNYKIREKKSIEANLRVIQLSGWERSSKYSDLGQVFIKPSPNLADINSILLYPGTCLLEATNISEGRGTATPFSLIGSPFINSGEVILSMKAHNFKGVELTAMNFTPGDIPGMAINPKHKGILCQGIKLTVTDPQLFRPVEFGLALISELKRLYPSDMKIKKDSFLRLCGSDEIYTELEHGNNFEKIINLSARGVEEFKSLRKNFLIYK